MTFDEVIKRLEELGTEQTRKTWQNHGASGEYFGVKIGDMKAIQKKIKRNYELSLELYNSGNADAMYFAGLISEPVKMSKEQLQEWAYKASWYMLSEYTVAWVAAESRFGRELSLEWINSDEERLQSAGWNTYSSLLAMLPDEQIDRKEVVALLKQIEKSIHNQPERTKYTMNGFVIAAGGYVPSVTEIAKAIAKNIGKVVVVMGKTACKVPDALTYIEKMEISGQAGKKKKTVIC